MTVESAWRVWNLRYLERIIVVVIIAVFMAQFIDRAARIDAELERANLELVVQDLQSRLLLFTAERRARGALNELRDYVGMNPVGTVTTTIGNYAGEYDAIEWSQIEPGQWAFDRQAGNLTYRVLNEDFADTELTAPKRIRYRLGARYVDRNGNGRFDADTDHFIALVLDAIDKDPWAFER